MILNFNVTPAFTNSKTSIKKWSSSVLKYETNNLGLTISTIGFVNLELTNGDLNDKSTLNSQLSFITSYVKYISLSDVKSISLETPPNKYIIFLSSSCNAVPPYKLIGKFFNYFL